RTAIRAEGVVVRLNAGGSHPQIDFTAASGAKISYPQGGLIFGYRPGQKVRVLYNPNNPGKTACIDTTGALWAVPILLAGIGLFLALTGFVNLLTQASAPGR